jgi:hypothetical protein
MNRTLRRPMFRRGGSTGTGITSGLDTTKPKRGLVDEPGGYAGIDTDMQSILERTAAQTQDPKIRSLYQPYLERPKGEAFNRFLMSTGLDLMGRPSTGNIFQTAALSAKGPTEQLFKDIDSQRLSKKTAEADLFKTLLSGNVSIAESAAGNEAGAAKTYEKIVIADKLREIMPRFLELKEKRQKGTLEQGEEIELKLLQEDYNAFRKKDVGEEALIDIYVKSLGDRALPNRVEDLYREDLKSGKRKYKGKDDPQIIKDAINAIRRELQNLADGGRAGYMNGGGADMAQQPMMMPQEPMTMDQGSMDDGKNNLISYDQLRARLPAEITDDIVELMSNSAEALEDFAMISSQQDVTQFNKKYSVNLVLPSEA